MEWGGGGWGVGLWGMWKRRGKPPVPPPVHAAQKSRCHSDKHSQTQINKGFSMHLGSKITRLLVCLLMAAGGLPGDQIIRLKKRLLQAPEDLQAHQVGSLKRRRPGHSHFLIQFSSPPAAEQIQELKRRGAAIMSYVPDAALVVSAGDDVSWDDLDLRFVGRLDAVDKLSPMLSPDGNFVVGEFHADADMDEARSLVIERHLQIDDRSNMPPTHLLVAGTLDAIARLAA